MSSLREAMLDLLTSVSIDTKESGRIRIKPWRSQRMIIDTVADALENDVHEIVILKCRQCAATTTASVIELLWALINPGVQGAIIADRTDNLERLRRIFANLLETLPAEWRDSDHRLIQNNRNGMVFANGSVLDLLAAGSNADLGASRAINLLHATECAQWRSLAGVESLKAALAKRNPHRLFIWESISHGFNWWYNYCQQAQQDHHMRFVFLGFWSNDTYRIEKDDPDYKIYMEPKKDGSFKLMDEEKQWAIRTRRENNIIVSPEAICWWRREAEFQSESAMWRHYPWYAEQSFIESGTGFFPARRTLEIAHKLEAAVPFKGFRYTFDDDFLNSRIDQVSKPEDANLRVWEMPQEGGVYVIGVDPSGGGGSESDNHAVQVFRCYSDRLVQCAEFQTNYPLTYQLAWVMCHLAGAYPDHVVNMDAGGIGAAVIPEIRNLRLLAERGFLQSLPDENILDIIGCVKWYLYERIDSLGGPTNMIAEKWNNDRKAAMYSECRDLLMQQNNREPLLEIRSTNLIAEMQAVIQDGTYIGAGSDTGKNDDLVDALVLAVHPYVTRVRNRLIAEATTWASVNEKPIMDDPNLVLSRAISRHMSGIWMQRRDIERRKF